MKTKKTTTIENVSGIPGLSVTINLFEGEGLDFDVEDMVGIVVNLSGRKYGTSVSRAELLAALAD